MTGFKISRSCQLATALLSDEVESVESQRDGGMRVVSRPMREILESHRLPEFLFFAMAPSRKERAELFGFGNEDIDVAFDLFRKELLRLVTSHRGDPEILRNGEPVLESLIKGLLQGEWDAKQGINPKEAAENASFWKTQNGHPTEVITPNDIDAMQNDALFTYQFCRYTRQALEIMLGTLRQINRELGPTDMGSWMSRH
jgi:hypothetical protein